MNVRPDALKRLEIELSRALGIFSSRDSVNTGPAPQYSPPVVVVPNKRTKDKEQRDKDWLLMDSDNPDLGSKEGKEDWTSFFDKSDEKAKKNQVEEFYKRLNRERPGSFGSENDSDDVLSGHRGKGLADRDTSRDDSKLPSTIRDSASRLRELLSNARDSSSPTRDQIGNLSDFLTGGDKEVSPADLRAHKTYMDEYRKVLDGGTPAASTSVNLMNPLAPLNANSGSPSARYLGGLDSLGDSSPASKPFSLGNVSQLATPTAPQDPNIKALNSWNPLYSPPKVEMPKPPPLAVQPFEAPRRRF